MATEWGTALTANISAAQLVNGTSYPVNAWSENVEGASFPALLYKDVMDGLNYGHFTITGTMQVTMVDEFNPDASADEGECYRINLQEFSDKLNALVLALKQLPRGVSGQLADPTYTVTSMPAFDDDETTNPLIWATINVNFGLAE